MAHVDVVLDTAMTIGDSPLWSPTENALYFVDVKAPALFRLRRADGRLDRWRVPSDLGASTLLADLSGALVALRSGLHRLEFATGVLRPIASPPFDPALFRFIEGGCDRAGRFWVGIMFDPADVASAPRAGSLHSYTAVDGLQPAPDAAELHNGMAWSADGTQMFVSHSNQQRIYSYRLEGGRLGARTPFATIPPADGLPDGAALDTEGGYWCALHGGGRLRRFHPDGTVDRDIALPVSQPTMCCFAGPNMDELYITSATDRLTDAQRKDEPLAGTLLRLRPGRLGVPRRCTLG